MIGRFWVGGWRRNRQGSISHVDGQELNALDQALCQQNNGNDQKRQQNQGEKSSGESAASAERTLQLSEARVRCNGDDDAPHD